MAQLILRLDDGAEHVLNDDVRPEVIDALVEISRLEEVFADISSAPTNGFWTHKDGRSNHSPVFEAMVEVVYRLMSDGGGWVLSRSWRKGAARLIVAQLAHVHGMAPLMPVDRERVARG